MLKTRDSSSEWIWIDSQIQLNQLLPELCGAGEIALDTEFHRERTYYPKLALVQIAWIDKIALLDPFALDLTALSTVFSGPVTLVLHAGTQDLEILSRVVGILPRSIFDTQLAAGFVGFSNPSLAVLSEKLLGVNLPKGDRLTDWTKRPLLESQLRYAASDVAYLVILKGEIERQLGAIGRLEWAWDESKLLLEKDRTVIPVERAWWKIKECRHLKGDSRKVAQSLAAWRELRAADLDVPVRYILSDLAIAVISQELPKVAEDLPMLRGVEHRFLAQGVDREIIEVVSQGRSMPERDLCTPAIETSEKRLKPIANLAVTWVTQLAQSLKIDPLLLATRADITGFLNGDQDSRLASGWRNEVLGEPITKLARGELALAVTDTGELELEQRSYLRYGRDI
ncbi:MAG: HRDC domain-containing protein [Actinomycetota bacterium]|nr:HRDC domain-containing protein [Actinomycetota bacterium]